MSEQHIICFKLVSLRVSFTEHVKLTKLLHDQLMSLHAQCQQGPSNVSAWMSSGVTEQQCAQTCQHIKLVALRILFKDSRQLPPLAYDLHVSVHAQCQPCMPPSAMQLMFGHKT